MAKKKMSRKTKRKIQAGIGVGLGAAALAGGAAYGAYTKQNINKGPVILPDKSVYQPIPPKSSQAFPGIATKVGNKALKARAIARKRAFFSAKEAQTRTNKRRALRELRSKFQKKS